MLRTMKRMRVAALIAVALPLVAAAQTTRTTPLNRTVIVVPNPNAVVPPECEQGLAPQPQPRVTPQERAAVAPVPVPQPPPAADLKSTLQAAVDAARRNDRTAFASQLARAKEILASYPPGGDRTVASDVVAVLDDLDRVWNYEFSSPTGAFFDASSDMHRMLEKYPGYEAAVRRQVITDQNGVRFYPSAESLDFLAGEAGTRLAPLTGRAAAPRLLRQKEPQVTEHVAPEKAKPVTKKPARTHARHVEHKRATTEAHVAKPKPAAKPAATHKAVEHKPVTGEAHVSKPKPAAKKVVESKPVERHAEATTTAAPAPAPTATAVPPPATASTTTQAPPPPAPATAAPPATETTATQPAQKPASTSHSNLIIPIVLIILGVGVLVLFSRSSKA